MTRQEMQPESLPIRAGETAPRRGRLAEGTAVVAGVAVLGLAAAIVLSVHRYSGSARGHAPVVAACAGGIAWTAAVPGPAIDLARATPDAIHAAFWVGVLSLAVGVAVVEWTRRVRFVHIGGCCAH